MLRKLTERRRRKCRRRTISLQIVRGFQLVDISLTFSSPRAVKQRVVNFFDERLSPSKPEEVVCRLLRAPCAEVN
ncbi:hypothetical protein AALO_G00179230 [Alosa alosa]|uniref:Uncharacterized protein n=1 Tax=Alosa alosa TaxID=278164 RepID=A0AAV6GC18_9TELE|nr:hypothetical protein AALO_G00179230 [Alosa alosa]